VLRPAEPGPAPAAAELVARLRTTAVAATVAAANGNGPVHAAALVAALCERAVAEQLVMEIGYDGEAGETVRAVEPFEVADGRMRAWCHLREDERTFLLERIAWARLAEAAGG
jgi:predicted DNA-binding transcriptional regulator YafY